MEGKYGVNKAPLVFWGRNNYNSWKSENVSNGFGQYFLKWYQNASTGFGVHNLWTYLIIPFNRGQYIFDSDYLRMSEEKLYVFSESKGYVESGFWKTHRIHPHLLSRLLPFLSNYSSHFRIGVHLRSTDRTSELNEFYDKIISTAKAIHTKASEKGAKKIVFFVSSDSWVTLNRALSDLRNRLDMKAVYLPNIVRSTTERTPIHLLRLQDERMRHFSKAMDEKTSDFFQKCLGIDQSLWGHTFNEGNGSSCLEVSRDQRPVPSYKLASDAVLESRFLAHTHFYVSMAGNFGSGPLLFRNDLPSIQFYPEFVPDRNEHPNKVMVPQRNSRELVWPCLFEDLMIGIINRSVGI